MSMETRGGENQRKSVEDQRGNAFDKSINQQGSLQITTLRERGKIGGFLSIRTVESRPKKMGD
jgi:hypothetical protein